MKEIAETIAPKMNDTKMQNIVSKKLKLIHHDVFLEDVPFSLIKTFVKDKFIK